MKYIVSFIFFVCTFIVYGQQTYTFEHYTKTDGLTENYISDISEDTIGRIWITTLYGITTFDGNKFSPIIREDGYYTSLVRNDLLFVNRDLHGDLWFGGYNGCIVKYDYETDAFKDVSLNYVTLNEYPIFFNTYQTPGSELYGLSEFGLFRYSKYSGKFHKAFREIHDIPGRRFTSMYIDSRKQIWLGSQEKGLYCISADSSQTQIYNFAKQYHAVPPRVNEFLPLSKNTFLLATSKGIFKITHSNFTDIHSELVCKKLRDAYISSMIQDNAGNIWIGTAYKGLWLLDSKGVCKRITTLAVDNTLITTITSLYKDSGNRIWIGTQDNGIFCYNPEKQKITNTSIHSGLRNNIVSSIIQDEKGNLWVGTDGGGITIFTKDLIPIKQLYIENNSFSDGILCLEQNSTHVWAGTWRGGLLKIDKKSFNIQSYTTENSGLLYNGIKSIAWLSKDTLLIGTHRNGIQALIISENKIISDLHITWGSYFPQVQNYVNQILIDKTGIIWVATIRNLYCIKNKKMIEVLENDSYKNPNNPLLVSSISEDTNGYIIAATNKGIFKISTHSLQKENITHFIPELKNAFIVTAYVSSESKYWFCTSNGLFQYNPKNHTYAKISLSQTLQRRFYTPRAIFKDCNNIVYIGTNEGLFSLSENIIESSSKPVKLVFSGFQIANNKITPGNRFLPKNIDLLDTLKLSYQEKNWTIEFQTICFNSRGSIECEYMLEGYNKSWIPLHTTREINFSNIPSGEYILRLKAWNQNSKNYSLRSLYIIISPPWWKTFGFILFSIITIISVLFSIYRLRLYNFKRQTLILEKEVNKKTKAIADQKEYIEEQNIELRFVSEKLEESNKTLLAQNEELENLTKKLQDESIELSEVNKTLQQTNRTKGQLFSIITNDITNSFASLEALSNTLYKDFEKLQLHNKTTLINTIYHGITTTKNLLENLIHWTKNQTNTIEVKAEYCKINEIFDEIHATFEHIIIEKNISLTFSNKNADVVYVDKQMIISVIRNLIHTCIQRTPKGGFINCSAQFKYSFVEIQIHDSGQELNQDILQTLFSIKKKTKYSDKTILSGSSIALLVCQQFIEQNNGNLTITNTHDKTIIYKLSLPVSSVQNQKIVITNDEIQNNDNNKEYTIAIIDDNSAILLLLGEYIKKDYIYKLYDNSNDFFNSLSSELPDIIISDIYMPVIDGYSICKKVKQSSKSSHIPVILISSNHEDITKQEAYECGADGFIEKPINKQLLLALISKVLQESKNKKITITNEKNKNLSNTQDDKFFKKFDELLLKNISNPDFTIDEIAKKLHISRTHLFRKVKDAYGISPKDYFIKIRMQAAAELLQYNDSKIIDVAFATGFNDASYFTKCFMKQYGVNPSNYKNAVNSKK